MGRLRLGRTGAGLFRLHVGGGRHAGGRGQASGLHVRTSVAAYVEPTPPAQPTAQPTVQPTVQPTRPVEPVGPQLDSRVGLVLRDGRELRLEAADPRARIFLTVASELLRPVADQSITRSG
jgi:hypothetical protein